jgi:hypothetical protein
MSALPSAPASVSVSPAFSSVKLSSALVTEAKHAAQTLRRSTAGQIEYWALLGKAVEDGGLTTREATDALNLNYKNDSDTARNAPNRKASQASSLVAQFTEFSASGALAQHVRHVIAQNAHPKQALKA